VKVEQFAGHPIVTIGAILVSIMSLVFTAFATRKKSAIDESTLVLGKWKELVEAHEERIKRMNEDFEAYRRNSREEREALKARVSELEEQVKHIISDRDA
jgi:predicted  nucleic acid-binding Zn-ribbon protein